jgi:2-methylcitrate dehydratase PrpD
MGRNMTTITEFAARLLSSARRDISHPMLSVNLVDTIAATVCGMNTHEGRFLTAHLVEPGPAPARDGALARIAALSAATRSTEFDSIHLKSGTTPAAIVVPAALALVNHPQARPGNDPRLGAATIAGIEAMTRFGMAVEGQKLVYRGIWPTYLTAPLGTAAAAAMMLGLDQEQTAHALAIALTAMAGRIGPPGKGTVSRWLMIGQAARAGVAAAFAAGQGVQGELSLLDGDWMVQAQGIPMDPKALTAQESALDGLSLKPFCSAKQVVAAVTAFQRLLAGGIAPDRIDEVLVEVPESYRRMIDRGVASDERMSSVVSAPYQLALAAFEPDGLFDIERATLADTPPVRALMSRVRVVAADDLQSHLPARWPARVTVTSAQGRHSLTLLDAPGDPGDPFDMAMVRAKAARFLGRAGQSQAQIDDWLDCAAQAASQKAAQDDLARRVTGLFPAWRP